MSTTNNGGPAFPTVPQQVWDGDREQQIGERPGQPGMTLRDYFAAKAMQGLLAQSDGAALHSDKDLGANYAYEMADAMLKAREA